MKRQEARPISREIDGGGWVKLWRKTLDSDVFAVPELWHLFCWCLLSANYSVRHVQVRTGRGDTVITVGPGQFIYGRKSLARALRLKESTARRRMKRLESMGTIAIQADTHFSLVTVCNWSIYQADSGKSEHPTGHPADTQRTGKGRARNTYENGKKAKKREKVKSGKKGESSRGDHKCDRGVWGELTHDVQRLCEETSKKVRFADKARNPEQWARDRELRIKVCYLVAAEIMPEAWLRDATEAVLHRTRKKGRDAAYWYTCLEEGAAERGKDLGQLLATCGQAIPPEVLAGDTSKAVVNNKPAHHDCACCVSEGLDNRQGSRPFSENWR